MATPIRNSWCKWKYSYQRVRSLHLSSRLTSESSVRVRFAPSPTGYLHLGGLRTALYNYLFAKSKGGTFILRIEDTDQSRVVADAVKKQEAMLQWTGVIPDEGPSQGGRAGPYVQSQRLELYQESAKELIKTGAAYHCFCSPKRLDVLRRDSVRRGETPRYDNRCRHLEPAEVKDKLDSKTPFVIRLKLRATDPWDDLIKGPINHNVADIEGDPVVVKSDGYPTYHLANVVDDHYMGITHILRGDEWQPSTPKHLLLYQGLGWSPPRFAHLPLIVNKDGTKLSKRQGDIHIEHFKDQGYLPQAVLSYVTTIGGGFDCDTSAATLPDLVQHFQLEGVRRNNGRLDPTFLQESNHAHLTRMLQQGETTQLLQFMQEMLDHTFQIDSRQDCSQPDILNQDYLLHIIHWALDERRISKLSDLFQPELSFLWQTPNTYQLRALSSQHSSLPELLTRILRNLDQRSEVATLEKDEVVGMLRREIEASQMKTGPGMMLMRQILSGVKEGPPVAEMIAVMGRENTVMRLRHCVQQLRAS